MSNLNMLKRQHGEVLTIINNIKNLMDNGNLDKNVNNISFNINILAGKLKMHLISEDKFLYPQLMNNDKEDIRDTAYNFYNEMGSVADILTSFVKKYNVPGKILQSKEDFITESRKVLNLIQNRINKEDKKLYPLLEY
ncbi:hemerythrin domain-containing protein [Lutispora thermophila]|uniref:Hemerythrin HHE cation binding domain-containing protein n=1 Tax=Lutispora thermophila DSM 19022 TaxID=1122184 RepID=A0A1M6DSJ6_9FIRM|nr:hemerythrin domain-containing protein [Lutispora thermophila]SHI76192.1 Hemerythrin HHE cation binding domain-containing protein [Lutispora thermophila DSM 19022]